MTRVAALLIAAAALAIAGLEQARTDVEPSPTSTYDRSCSPGRGCSFGPRWSDDVDVALGRNGCDTRSDIMRRDLRNITLKPGTHGCVVLAGDLTDPYTGEHVRYRRELAEQVPVAHVLALRSAWDLGASTWTPERRRDFANDPRNLVATTQHTNAAKGDKSPGEWMPPTPSGRCFYAIRYLVVADVYQLPVTGRDRAALDRALGDCSTHPTSNP